MVDDQHLAQLEEQKAALKARIAHIDAELAKHRPTKRSEPVEDTSSSPAAERAVKRTRKAE